MTCKVKICGLTTPEDARAAELAGADAIGLVFYDKSPRAVSINQAIDIVASLPPFVVTVGLFVDADLDFVEEVITEVPLGLLQFHGHETEAECMDTGLPYLKAIRMDEKVNLPEICDQYASASGILVDAYHPDLAGGTGEIFDWSLLPKNLAMPIILAGGLTAENVAEGIEMVEPYAVDVSSGVEDSPGQKSVEKMDAFCQAVKGIR